MMDLQGEFMEQRLRTKCGRCKDERAWLTSLTGVAGVRTAHLILCRTPSCHFLEIRNATDDDTAQAFRARAQRAERALRTWRWLALAAIMAWPLVMFVTMLAR